MLRQGLALTWCLAAVGATGRVVVPILIQQAIDKGIAADGGVRVGFVGALCLVAAVALVVAAFAQRTAVVRLGRRSEQALYHLRARLIAHIHRLSLADHNEERRGALVARVTSDIETLAQFFQWGGLAWLLDGPLVLMVGAVMIAYNWILAVVAFAVAAPLGDRAADRPAPPRRRLRQRTRAQRGDARRGDRGRHRRRDDPGLRRRRHAGCRGRHHRHRPSAGADPGERDRGLPVPVRRGLLVADHRRRRGRRRAARARAVG